MARITLPVPVPVPVPIPVLALALALAVATALATTGGCARRDAGAGAATAHPAAPPLANTAAPSAGSLDAAVVEEVQLIVGGMFAVDHLGPDHLAAVKRRAMHRAADYLLALQRLVDGASRERFSNLYPEALLDLTREADAPGTVELAIGLLHRFDRELQWYDRSGNTAGFLQSLASDDERALYHRLAQRRATTRQILSELTVTRLE